MLKDIKDKKFIITNNTLTHYNGTDKIVEIPKEVTIIDNQAFANNKNIEKIILHKDIETIGMHSFKNCENLKEINLENVKKINSYAFIQCKQIKAINLTELKLIGRHVFEDCKELENVIIGDHLETINDCVFCHCNKLKNIKIGKKLSYVNSNAFVNCTNLNNFDFSNIKKIEYQAFNNTGFKQLELENIEFIDDCAFGECKNLKIIKLKNIENAKNCFFGSNIKEVEVENCKNLSFNSMPELKTIKIKGKINHNSLTTFIGAYNPNLTEVTGPDIITEDGVVYNGDKTILISYLENRKSNIYYMPNSVKEINKYAFYQINKLNKLILSENLEILKRSTLDIKHLEYLKIPNNIKEIEECAIFTRKPIVIEMPNDIKISPYMISDDWTDKITIKTKEKKLSNIYFNKFIENYNNIEIIYKKTLEELIEEGKTFHEASNIIKKQELIK